MLETNGLSTEKILNICAYFSLKGPKRLIKIHFSHVQSILVKTVYSNVTKKLKKLFLSRSEAIGVTFGLQLVHINHLYEAEQLLTCKYWVRQTWFNQLITWDPKEWDDIEEVSTG